MSDADLVGYRVYSALTAGSQTTLEWSGAATSATIRSNLYGSDRYYKVAAYDVFGTESTTPPVTGALRPSSPAAVDTTAPVTPTGLAATITTTANASDTRADVSWTAVADTDGDLAGYRRWLQANRSLQTGHMPTWTTQTPPRKLQG